MAEHDDHIERLLGELTLERKVLLLTGRDFWSTHPLPEIGLRSMVLSDGPSGVRGESWDERDPSLNLPSASCLSASWDVEVARDYARVMAVEARRQGVDVVLGPTINLHRSPLGGRHFEAFSEDPRLTATLATAWVAAMQEQGVGATPKHYVANDYETERFTASTEVDERTLRELYLLAFEEPVVVARPWLVMSAYNSVNGTRASEHRLLASPLDDEWGFDGVVVSDWTAVRSIAAARVPQDLAMPGPDGPWGQALVAAVEAGEVAHEAIDRKVRRLLRLAARVGALDGVDPVRATPDVDLDGTAFARRAAVEGMVLLRNDGVLPVDPAALTTVAVVGHNAIAARTQGGGSATVLPEEVVGPLAGLRAGLADVEVDFALGAIVQEGVGDLPLDELHDPVADEPGLHVDFLDDSGEVLFEEVRKGSLLKYIGGEAPVGTAASVRLRTRWTPAFSGRVAIGCATVGPATLSVDGEVVLDELLVAEGDDPGAGLLDPPSVSVPLTVEAGVGHDVDLLVRLGGEVGTAGAFAVTLGTEPDDGDRDTLIADAVRVADGADLAVVVVGTNSQVESEGYDRSTLALPGRQDELVAQVAATGTPTVVVVNSGSPVLMPWVDDVAAVLIGWFGGQQMGEALTDVLVGDAEPGGRLPTTWPRREEDVPVIDVTPVDGRLAYDEGIHIGYRAWLRSGVEPLAWFGEGMGYTTWALGGLDVLTGAGPDTDGRVRVTVANTGERAGKQVVQLYLARPDSEVDRPVRWFAAHAVVRAEAGADTTVELAVSSRAFAHWDDGWRWEDGTFDVLVGTSAGDVPLSAGIDCAGPDED